MDKRATRVGGACTVHDGLRILVYCCVTKQPNASAPPDSMRGEVTSRGVSALLPTEGLVALSSSLRLARRAAVSGAAAKRQTVKRRG